MPPLSKKEKGQYLPAPYSFSYVSGIPRVPVEGEVFSVNEILIFGVIIGGIFSAIGSAVLVHMGELIDRFPVEGEGERERSMWSPREFTRYAVIFYWPLYIVGAAMMIPGTRVLTVGGIAILFGLVLFMLTALVFSVATYNLMQSGREKSTKQRFLGSFFGTRNLFRVSPYRAGSFRSRKKEKDSGNDKDTREKQD